MRLLTKTTLLYLGLTLMGFLAAGILIFQFFQHELEEETDEALQHQQDLTMELLRYREGPVKEGIAGFSITPLPGVGWVRTENQAYGYTFIADEDEELEPYRTLKWEQQVGDTVYEVQISQPAFEEEDTIEAIYYGIVHPVMGLVLLITGLMWVSSKFLWRPFHRSLRLLGSFRPSDTQPLAFEPVHTHEFRELNGMLQQVTEKVRQDYQNLKAFSENAAHELQTPLAVAQSKLEGLLQSPTLSAAYMETAQGALEALQRMKRLNEGLLLLSKIENRQFTEMVPCDIQAILQKHVDSIRELAALKDIPIHFEATAHPQPVLNPILLDLLISNLLSNALRHNHAHGRITVRLTADGFSIANTGKATPLDSTQLFQRFQRLDPGSQGLGLGLAIAHEICSALGLKLHYEFEGEMHIFRVQFVLQN